MLSYVGCIVELLLLWNEMVNGLAWLSMIDVNYTCGKSCTWSTACARPGSWRRSENIPVVKHTFQVNSDDNELDQNFGRFSYTDRTYKSYLLVLSDNKKKQCPGKFCLMYIAKNCLRFYPYWINLLWMNCKEKKIITDQFDHIT